MVTLIASLTGFISALLPHVLNLFKDKSDKAHEISILDRQINMQKALGHTRLEEINSLHNLEELKTRYSKFNSGVVWVDAFNGMVRPVLAYAFFFLYAAIKSIHVIIAYKQLASVPLILLIETLWSVEDQAMFAGIVSFYFGQRAMHKINKGNL